jgi:uncharacterized protein YcfJ
LDPFEALSNLKKQELRHEILISPVCRSAAVRRQSRSSATGTILGTMIGAAVGHNVAKSKRGQKVGRIAGAVLGASIGNDISNRRRSPGHIEYHNEERCETRHHTEYQDVVVGYDVSYQYHGRTYNTRMDEYPGDEIRVAVDVRPVY